MKIQRALGRCVPEEAGRRETDAEPAPVVVLRVLTDPRKSLQPRWGAQVVRNDARAYSGRVATIPYPFSVFGEAYGALDFGEGYPDRHSVQSGVTLGLRRNLEFDIRGGLGLTDSVPDWLVGAGLSFRLPH